MTKVEVRSLPDNGFYKFGIFMDGELKLTFGWYTDEGAMQWPDGTDIDDKNVSVLEL